MENQVSVVEEKALISTGGGNKANSYCSVVAKTEAEKMALFNMMNGDTEGKRIADMINMEIEVQDVIFELVELLNEETGEIQEAPRAILVSPKGETFNGTSFGIMSSIQRCITAFGEPTWKPAKKFVVKQVPTKKGSMLKLVMVPSKK